MYLRFVTSERDDATGAEAGLFGIAYEIRWEEAEAPEWIRIQVDQEIDWFNEHLDRPDRLWRRGGRHGRIHGVCWFRSEAAVAIGHARYLAWLLTEADYPVLELRSRRPGEIIWQDDQQIVARPPRDLPRMFA